MALTHVVYKQRWYLYILFIPFQTASCLLLGRQSSCDPVGWSSDDGCWRHR